MKSSLKQAPLAAFGLAAIALAASKAELLVVNGKKTAGGYVKVEGKTYVSLDALKAGGAEVSVSGDKVGIQFKPMNDQLQVNAVEGSLGEWVQNQGWRVKVHSVTPSGSPFGKGKGFTLKFEFRNLLNKPMNFGASGLKGMMLMEDQGKSLRYSVTSFKELYKACAPGAGYTAEIKFGQEAGDTSPIGKAEKLLILFGQSGKNRFKDIRIDLSSDE